MHKTCSLERNAQPAHSALLLQCTIYCILYAGTCTVLESTYSIPISTCARSPQCRRHRPHIAFEFICAQNSRALFLRVVSRMQNYAQHVGKQYFAGIHWSLMRIVSVVRQRTSRGSRVVIAVAFRQEKLSYGLA